MDFGGIRDDICAGQYRLNLNTNDQPLRDRKKVSDVWPQLPSDADSQLHIYVSVPAHVTGVYFSHVSVSAQAQDI